MQKLRKISLVLTFIYLGVFAGVAVFQRNFIYVPSQTYMTPEEVSPGTSFKELRVKTEDGVSLVGWYAPATTQDTTLVFFHGNADTLQNIWPVAGPYIEAGYGFLIAEYRGYSSLPGKPDEAGLYADGRAFVNKLIEDGVEAGDIVLMGHSLGTGVATQLASEFKVRGLMLVAPFLSLPDMAQVRFPYFPGKYVTLDKFDNAAKITKLKIPVLVGVSGADGVVPTEHEKRLFELANEPKKMFFSPTAGHSGLFEAGLYPASLEWLEGLEDVEAEETRF